MSLESPIPPRDPYAHERRLQQRRMAASHACMSLSSAQLDRLEPLLGIGAPGRLTHPHSEDAGQPWPGQDSGAEGEI